MAAILFYLVAAAVSVAAVVRAGRVRSSDNKPASRAYVVLLAALGVTFAVMATPSQAWVNRFVPDLFKLVGNCSSLVAAFGAQTLTLRTSFPSERAVVKVRLRLVGLLVVLSVLVVMFFWPHPVTLTGSFDAYLAADPTLAVYTLAYSLYIGAATGDIAVMSWRFSRHAARYLRAGLRVIALAGVVGTCYAATKIAIVVQHVATGSRQGAGDQSGVCHAPFGSPACAVAVGIPGVTVLVLVLGVLLAGGATRLDRLHRRVDQYRAYRRLEALWHHLDEALPEIVRMPGEPRRPAVPRDIQWHLARRLVQIRDGLLLLAPYRSPEVATEAHAAAQRAGLADTERDAVVEAAQIAAALQARAAGISTPTDAPAPPRERLGDLESETAWLQRVSRAFAQSPIVAAYRTPPPVREPRDRAS